jgi:hypothetical protein
MAIPLRRRLGLDGGFAFASDEMGPWHGARKHESLEVEGRMPNSIGLRETEFAEIDPVSTWAINCLSRWRGTMRTSICSAFATNKPTLTTDSLILISTLRFQMLSEASTSPLSTKRQSGPGMRKDPASGTLESLSLN